jgi:hypothetical protein
LQASLCLLLVGMQCGERRVPTSAALHGFKFALPCEQSEIIGIVASVFREDCERLIVFIGAGMAGIQIKVETRFDGLTNEIDDGGIRATVGGTRGGEIAALPVAQQEGRGIAIAESLKIEQKPSAAPIAIFKGMNRDEAVMGNGGPYNGMLRCSIRHGRIDPGDPLLHQCGNLAMMGRQQITAAHIDGAVP